MGQKNQEMFLILKIIIFVSGTSNSHHREQETCHWQSVCYETPLRFNISLRETFSKSSSLRVMTNYDESAVLQILYKVGTLSHVDSQKMF